MARKRGFRLLKIAGILLGLALVGLVVAKLVEEARGKNAWDAYLSEQQAQGNKILWNDFIPPEVPNEENVTTYPGLDLKALNALDPAAWPNQRADSPPQPGWKFAQPYSLLEDFEHGAASSEEDAAQQLIDHFAQHNNLLDTLRSATKRSSCRFDLNYANPQLMDLPLQEIQHAFRTLNTLALAHLRLKQPAEAHANILSAIRLIKHLDSTPSLIVAIVQTSQMDRTLQAVWAGLRDHLWTAPQLQSIAEHLGAWHPSTRLITSLQQDRAAMFTIMDHQSQTSQHLLFRGWAYQNMVSFGKLLDRYVFAPSGKRSDSLDYERTLALESDVQVRRTRIFGRYPHPYDLFTVIALPSLPKITSRVLQLDASLSLALKAIELETLYQANKTYPIDFETSAQLLYRLKSDGTPQLYVLGLNNEDDGGVPDKDRTKGDWVWQFTPTNH